MFSSTLQVMAIISLFIGMLYAGKPIHPTIINKTGEYYIVDNTSTYDFANQSIICNYYNTTNTLQTRNCYITCDKRAGCINSTIECNNSPFCSIDCSSNQSCSHSVINASATNNFTLNCNGISSCTKLDLSYSNTPTVKIECNQNYSCSNIGINGNHGEYSDVLCIYNNSCYLAQINLSNTKNVSFTCNGSYYNLQYKTSPSCLNVSMTVTNSSLVKVTSGSQLKWSALTVQSANKFILNTIDEESIRQSSFHLYDVKSIFLSCYFDGSCDSTTFNIYDDSNVTWWCGYKENHTDYTSGNSPCIASTLHALNANSLDIVMNSFPMVPIDIYGPEYYISNDTNSSNHVVKRSNIKCIYYGCSEINYFSKNGLIDWNIYFQLPGCIELCDRFYPNNWKSGYQYTACVMEWQFKCGHLFKKTGLYYPIFDGPNCNGVCCDNETFVQIQQQFKEAKHEHDNHCDEWWDFEASWIVFGVVCSLWVIGGGFCCYYQSFRKKKNMFPPLL